MKSLRWTLAGQFLAYYIQFYLALLLVFVLLSSLGESPYRAVMGQLAGQRLHINDLELGEQTRQALAEVGSNQENARRILQQTPWLEAVELAGAWRVGKPERSRLVLRQGSLSAQFSWEGLVRGLSRSLTPQEARSLAYYDPSASIDDRGVELIELASVPGWVTLDTRSTPVSAYLRLVSPWRASLSFLGLIVVPFLSAWFTTRRVTRPLADLENASRRLAAGDFAQRVAEPPTRELTELARAFNHMVEELDERQRQLQANNVRLQEVSALKSQFLASVSHELRTPLTAILGQSQMLLDELPGPLQPEQSQLVGKLQRNANHLLQLINDLLDLSRIEAGEMQVEEEEFDLCECVQEAILSVEPQLQERGLKLRLQLGQANPVRADYLRTRQILTNLLANAVKFTERGEVGVRLSSPGQVEVWDTGVGILPADQERIFDEFRQLDAGARRRHGGSGLGLAIARRLARLQRGEIGVISEPGSGSTFRLTLPPVD